MKNHLVADVAIVLVGGPSSRMGEPKALFEVNGKSMLISVMESLHLSGINRAILSFKNKDQATDIIDKLGFEIIDKSYYFHNIPIPFYLVFDNEFSQSNNSAVTGMLSPVVFAIQQGWDTVQITPCDTPFLEPSLPRLLFSKLSSKYNCAVPISHNGIEPLLICSRTKPLYIALQNEMEAATQVIAEMKCIEVGPEEWIAEGISELSFINVNSKDEIND